MSSCIVQWDGEAGFEPSSAKLVRARKEHRCCECGETIAIGDLHEHFRGRDPELERWDSWRTCARCLNVFKDYFAGSRVLGMMVEDFEAEHGFDYRDGIPADFAPCRAQDSAA